MTHGRARLIAAVIAITLCMDGAGTANLAAAQGYTLLRLGGSWVKWGEPRLGTRAEVTYALADRRMDTPDAFNCRSMTPVETLLADSRIPEAAFRREVDAAFAVWSRAADITFRAVSDAGTADIVIGAQRVPRGRAYTNVAFKPGTRKGTRSIDKSLVCLNPARGWKVGFDGNLDVYDVRYTLIHEIGHAIGLDHPGPHGQLMSFKYVEAFRGLQPGDMDGAHALYGGAGAPAAPVQRAAAGDNPHSDATTPQLSLGH